MRKMGQALTAEGYTVINLDYPSHTETIENISKQYLASAIEAVELDPTDTIHFVTHSMGGIIVRYFLANNSLPNLGKLVMLAPPNQGSQLADFFQSLPFAKNIFGPALQQLKTDSAGIHHTLPLPTYPIGVIAGKYDGKVSVDYTKLEDMTDFLVVPRVHTYIMDADETIQATLTFLKSGKFSTH